MRKTLGLHCHLLRINSKARPPETTNLLDDDAPSAEQDADPTIRELWQHQLAESYRIESRMQAYAAGTTGSSARATIHNNSGMESPLLPTAGGGGGGHTRSSSVSSNSSSSINGPAPSSTTSITSTTLQTAAPLEMGNTSLESEQKQEELQQKQHNPIVDETETSAIATQYGRYMTEEDVTACRGMIREFVVQSMIPFMERNIQHWNEQVASARRGLTGRLFGASRRLFGSTTRTQSTHSIQTIPATGPNVPAGVNQVTM